MKKNNAGQILLIVMLTMAVLTTIALSAVSRSISQIEVTTREQESIRAFSAAEAGLEDALVNVSLGQSITEDIDVNTTGGTATISNYNAQVTAYPTPTDEYVYPLEMLSGETATVWFVTKDGNNYPTCNSTNPCLDTAQNISICWGNNTINGVTTNYPAPAAALLINIVYNVGTANSIDLRSYQFAVDPDSTRRATNQFGANDSTNCNLTNANANFNYRKRIHLSNSGNANAINVAPNQIRYMTVTFLYNETVPQTFAVRLGNGDLFPAQGKLVTSTGQAGNSTRKIEAYLLNPTISSVFGAAMFSPFAITK